MIVVGLAWLPLECVNVVGVCSALVMPSDAISSEDGNATERSNSSSASESVYVEVYAIVDLGGSSAVFHSGRILESYEPRERTKRCNCVLVEFSDGQ